MQPLLPRSRPRCAAGLGVLHRCMMQVRLGHTVNQFGVTACRGDIRIGIRWGYPLLTVIGTAGRAVSSACEPKTWDVKQAG